MDANQQMKEAIQKEAGKIVSDSIANLGQIKEEQAKLLDEIKHLKESNRNEIAKSLDLLQRFKLLRDKPQVSPWQKQKKPLPPKFNAALKGIHTGIFIGYGKQWGHFYLGLEATYLVSHEKASLEGLVLRKKNTAEIAIRPGFVLGYALFYGKIGFLNSQFKLADQSLCFKGMSWRVGADIKFLPKILLGFGYTYEVYEKKRSIDSNHSSLNLESTSHRVMFRIGYKT
ncbi:MAG: outer membrane protein [Alphaproteobacteria bacterium]